MDDGRWLAFGAVAWLAAAGRLRQGSSARQEPYKGTFDRGGFPWCKSIVLWHGTAWGDKIRADGFKVRSQTGIVGAGGRHVHSVSTTILYERAIAIALGLDTLRRVGAGQIRLIELFDRLSAELGDDTLYASLDGSDFQEALPWRVSKEKRLAALRVLLRRLEAGWRSVYLSGEGKSEDLSRWGVRMGDRLLVSPSRALPSWMEPWSTPLDRYGAAFDLYRRALSAGDHRKRCFNPYFTGDMDVRALGRRPASAVGVSWARSEVPRICANHRGAHALGYLDEQVGLGVQEKLDSWKTTCDNALQSLERVDRPLGGDLFDLVTSFDGWKVEDVGARSRSRSMLYAEQEQEVRVFDPARLRPMRFETVARLRERYHLGDRLTFPWFDDMAADVRVYPPGVVRHQHMFSGVRT